MQSILHQQVLSLAVIVMCALAMGVIYDRMSHGRWRDVALGITGGLATLGVMSMSLSINGFVVDARSPILLITALCGGPIGALVAAPLPIILRIEIGGPGVIPGVSAIVGACLMGSLLRLWHDGTGRAISRRSVLFLALLSPLLLLNLFLTQQQISLEALSTIALPLAITMPFGTAILGLILVGEIARSDLRRTEIEQEAFNTRTNHVNQPMLEQQLEHFFQLHQRYGAQFAYLLLSIDDGAGLRRRLGAAGWNELRAEIALVIRAAVRDCDVCAPLDFDRFAVLLPYTGPHGMLPVAQRLQNDVMQTVRIEGEPVTLSVGLCHVEEVNSALDLMVVAEHALIYANDSQPKGAIGPPSALIEAEAQITRSFPGAIEPSASPAASEEPAGSGNNVVAFTPKNDERPLSPNKAAR